MYKDGFSSSDWYEVGVKLGVLESDLRAIERDEKDADQYFRSALTKWLETNSNATYNELVDTLNSKLVYNCIFIFSQFQIKANEMHYYTTSLVLCYNIHITFAKPIIHKKFAVCYVDVSKACTIPIQYTSNEKI